MHRSPAASIDTTIRRQKDGVRKRKLSEPIRDTSYAFWDNLGVASSSQPDKARPESPVEGMEGFSQTHESHQPHGRSPASCRVFCCSSVHFFRPSSCPPGLSPPLRGNFPRIQSPEQLRVKSCVCSTSASTVITSGEARPRVASSPISLIPLLTSRWEGILLTWRRGGRGDVDRYVEPDPPPKRGEPGDLSRFLHGGYFVRLITAYETTHILHFPNFFGVQPRISSFMHSSLLCVSNHGEQMVMGICPSLSHESRTWMNYPASLEFAIPHMSARPGMCKYFPHFTF